MNPSHGGRMACGHGDVVFVVVLRVDMVDFGSAHVYAL